MDGFSNNDILKVVREIKMDCSMTNASEGHRISHFKSRYPEFFEKFPKLMLAAMNPTFDIKFLELMLHQRQTMLSAGNKDAYDQVNTDVYELLNEKYVYPVVPKNKLEEAARTHRQANDA